MMMLPLLLLLLLSSFPSSAWAFSVVVAPTRRSPVAAISGRVHPSYSYRNPSYCITSCEDKNNLALRMNGSGNESSAIATTTSSPSIIKEALAGLTVAFSLLSKAIACSSIVGINPILGIWSSVIMGITAPLIGSRAGVISGTAAVVIVPLSALTVAHGVEYMPLCIILSAIMQGLFGACNLAKMADLVSEEVLSGFLNSLGFILLFSQAKVFKAAKAANALAPAVAMATLCFSIVQLLPLITKAVPSSLVGLVVSTGVGMILGLPLATLECK